MQTALQLSGLQLPRTARISPQELGLSGGTTWHPQLAKAALGEVSEAQSRHWCQENKNTPGSLEKQILETAGLGEDILERMFSTEKSQEK